jgi:hypothetical protein
MRGSCLALNLAGEEKHGRTKQMKNLDSTILQNCLHSDRSASDQSSAFEQLEDLAVVSKKNML